MRAHRAALITTVLALLAALVMGYLLVSVNRDPLITIGAGSKDSASYRASLEMQAGLKRQGFDSEIVVTDQSIGLIDQLVDPDKPVDITFTFGNVDLRRYPQINSLGTVERLPMLFATMPGTPRLYSLADTRGMRIDVGPRNSARERFVVDVLKAFDVTAENSTFLNLSNAAEYDEYVANNVQIATARWSDTRPFLMAMAVNGQAIGIPVPENEALDGLIPSADAMTLPIGVFRIHPPKPAEPFSVIGQLMTVIANDDLSPAAVYAVAAALTEMYSPGSALSEPGEFPNFANRQLPINATAADYYATGQIPWQYQYLPPMIADSFVSIIVLLSILLIAASVYGIFLPEVYSLWTGVLKPRSEERYISAMERAVADGRELTPRERQRLSEILERQDEGRVLRQRAETLRPQLSDPIDGQAPGGA